MKTATLVASGDLRLSANQVCWPAQAAMEETLTRALKAEGWGVRRALFERLGGFDESFAYSEDWDFALRAAAVTVPRRIAGVTVEVRMRDSGHASLDFGPERLDCLRRLAQRHGLPELEPRTFWEVAQHVARAARRPAS